MRPDMKNDQYEISNRFEFCFSLHESHIGTTGKLLYVIPCKIMFTLETNMAEIRRMEKESLLTGTLKVH